MKGSFTYCLHNFGCKSNSYETDALGQYFAEQGGHQVFDNAEADLILFNTCTVTAEAGRKARQALRRARAENGEAKIVAMGCHSQLEDMSKLADLCGGTSNRLELAKSALQQLWGTKGQGEMSLLRRDRRYEELGPVLRQSETRAKIKIADGCEEYCTYCAICLARGILRSRDRGEIIKEAQALVESGHKEIVLTATNVTAFEADLGHDSLALAELLKSLNEIPGLCRIRLGSLEPQALTHDFIHAIEAVDKLCHHFHISLQSGSDSVLEMMGRNYSAARYLSLVETIRSVMPASSITTDIMVGFPGEREKDFQATCELAKRAEFTRIHVFRYSPRPGTKAARMTQIDPEVSRERSERLQELADVLAEQQNLAHLGKHVEMILEQDISEENQDGIYFDGYTAQYLPGVMKFSPEQNVQGGDYWQGVVKEITDGKLQIEPTKRLDCY